MAGQILLLPLVEVFPDVGRQQAADAVVGEEHVKVPQQAALGFVRLVLRLQELVGDDLKQTRRVLPTCRYLRQSR